MKKIILVFVSVVTLGSCGSDKKNVESETTEKKPALKYSLEMDLIYEKDDSLSVVYQLDDVMQYEKAINYKIEGSALPQKIKIDFPEGESPENLNIIVSTNKEQSHITINNVSIKIGNTTIDGSNYKYSDYFLTDASFSWDLEKSRYNLVHTNEYPPALVGNEKLLSLMLQ
jgi:hypothetical protein